MAGESVVFTKQVVKYNDGFPADLAATNLKIAAVGTHGKAQVIAG